MGLLDALLGDNSGSGLLGGLPSAWQFQNPSPPDAAEEKRKQDAAFMAAIGQNADNGVNPFVGNAPSPFNSGGPAPPAVNGGSTPFGLGGINLPQGQTSQGAPASGPFPAVPPPPIFVPQPQGGPAPQAAAPAPVQNAAPGPINTMDVGGYQMPQYGTAADYTPAPAQAVPPKIANAQAQAPADQPSGIAQAAGSVGNHIAAALQSIGGPGSLFRHAISDPVSALITGQRTDATGIAQQNQQTQFQAIRQTLIDNGETPKAASSKAFLAVTNPEAGKTILTEALTSKEKYQKTGTDAFGGETYGFVNERDQKINGKSVAADGAAAGATGGYFAPGVKSIDSTLKGKDYLEQFSPEVQAAVQDYVDGKSMPTGNPRKGFTQTVKMIAQKYGADTGQSVDDATYSARRTMRNQLSSSAPSSLGGQINIGNTAAGHLADLTERAVDLGNKDIGLAGPSHLINDVRGLTTDQSAKMEALKGAAQHYGQEITKFYAGSPGGTAERDRFIESVNGAKTPKELAAILSTEGELMRSRLDALGGQIKGVLGDEGLKQYPVLRPDGEAALAKVEHNVSRLRGGQASAATQTAAPTIQNGATATNPKTGQKITFINGKWQ